VEWEASGERGKKAAKVESGKGRTRKVEWGDSNVSNFNFGTCCPLVLPSGAATAYSSNCRQTPAGPVRWRYWIPLTSRELIFSVIYIRVPCHQPITWVSFLGHPTIRTRQILLGFFPSVQITSQFMSHDWELLVCMESQ
jgi:hypothetical protein